MTNEQRDIVRALVRLWLAQDESGTLGAGAVRKRLHDAGLKLPDDVWLDERAKSPRHSKNAARLAGNVAKAREATAARKTETAPTAFPDVGVLELADEIRAARTLAERTYAAVRLFCKAYGVHLPHAGGNIDG